MVYLKRHDHSGRDFYESLYASGLSQQAEWLRRGAVQKVNSIEALLSRQSIAPRTILELGCGPGAVILECRRRNLAQRYIGVDYSIDAISHLRSICTDIEGIQADITAQSFSILEPVDVVILSHVIEHLEAPGQFIADVLRKLKFSYIVIEVPLEDLVGARLKNLFRDRRINTSGHVQFFTRSSFLQLVTSQGLTIIDRRRYVPVLDLNTLRFLRAKDGLSRLQFARMVAGAMLSWALRPIWSRLYYSHYAVLCKPPRDDSENLAAQPRNSAAESPRGQHLANGDLESRKFPDGHRKLLP